MMTKLAADGTAHRQHQSPQKVPSSVGGQKRRAELLPSPAAELLPPAKFRKRLGSGYPHVNVRDPLNLGSVRPDNPNDPNFAKPIQVIATNVNDPLNLQNLSASSAPSETPGQKRKRKRNRPPQGRDESADEPTSDDFSPPPSAFITASGGGGGVKRRFTWKRGPAAVTAGGDKADAELAPEAKSSEHGALPSTSEAADANAIVARGVEGTDAEAETRLERRRKMAERYRYGNFNNYQMRREFRLDPCGVGGDPQHQQFVLLQAVDDPRMRFFCPDWFRDKAVLDIGTNAGHFAISLARAFQPRRVVGIDIDSHLVGAARKNVRHFCDKDTKMTGKFPASFGANFGTISAPSTSAGPHFPDNVWFFCENYVLSSDSALDEVREEFDIIFALACSKWVHLNWGDAGIRRFFHRAFRQLRTGGRFVLETAPFKDYRKHCNKKGADRPPEAVLKNFDALRLHPDEFTTFLLTSVGFSHHEELDSAHSKSLGISGRLQVFYKGQFMLITGEEANHEDVDNDDDGVQPTKVSKNVEEKGDGGGVGVTAAAEHGDDAGAEHGEPEGSGRHDKDEDNDDDKRTALLENDDDKR
uniref:RNA methyltransferase n=1 Tax=Globodera rostochiensis TaxID=31243 RepID=A0A914HHY8_GLORO